MKKIIFALSLIISTISLQGNAFSQEEKAVVSPFLTIEDYLKVRSSEGEFSEINNKKLDMWLTGWFEGYFIAEQAIGTKLICFNSLFDVSNQSLDTIILQYIENNQVQLTEPASAVMLASVINKFPCNEEEN